ncbi:MAG: DNRLRE domain-containing protein [Actinomycetota bacterium]
MGRRWFIGVLVALVVAGLPQAMPTARAADPVLVGAGDIAYCGNSNDSRTAELVEKSGGIPFTLGDNAYAAGTARQFADCYHPTWGRFADRTHPVVGDNEYDTDDAAPYFDYFGAAAGDPDEGWYSYDVGAWHIVVLNSNCGEVGGCGSGSPQERWLRADLAAANARCLAAMWHHPRFSSVSSNSATRALWKTLQEYGAEMVLSGHHHVYERFAPQDADGRLDANGIRQFVVGTGGRSHASFNSTKPNSEVRNNRTYGVLKLTLRSDGYNFDFVPIEGSSFRDSGHGSCDRGGGGGGGETPGEITVAAEADARVESDDPNDNFGSSSRLVADGSPATASYVRFAVNGVGAVSKATLRLYVKDKSSNGPEVYLSDPAWSERSVTWNNRPPRAGPLLADIGSVAYGQWVEYDVSAAVTGDGLWSFELTADSSDGIDFSSSEASSNRPQLVLVPAVLSVP